MQKWFWNFNMVHMSNYLMIPSNHIQSIKDKYDYIYIYIYIGVVNGTKKTLKFFFSQMFLTNICFHDVFF